MNEWASMDNLQTDLAELNLKEQIKHFVQNASIEVTPKVRTKIKNFSDVINPGRRVFVTYLPGSQPDNVIETSIRLRKEGMEPVPHLAARSMTGAKQLYETLKRLRYEADVRDVLIIGGGVDKPVGKFKSTLDMLETGFFEEFGLRSIGVAGHPEGNNDIPEDHIRHALQFKNEYARQNNIHMYIVTQFVLTADPVFDWLEKIEHWGNQLPVNIGLPGPARLQTLMRFAKLCDVNTSFNFIRKQGLRMFKLKAECAPDEPIARLSEYYANTPDCPITRLHFYNFGGIRRTMSYIKALENGHFDTKAIGYGLKMRRGFVV